MGVRPSPLDQVRVAIVSDDDMMHLDPGERAAIALAHSERGALLLIDETAGRIEKVGNAHGHARSGGPAPRSPCQTARILTSCLPGT